MPEWEKVTTTGFGDDYIVSFEAFTTFADSLYVSGSRGASSAAEGLGGAKIFRLLPGKCFIATAAYGSDQADDVVLLRRFRNNFLLTNSVGRALVNLYYSLSPSLASAVAKYEVLKTATRMSLKPLVYTLKYPLGALLVCILGGLLVMRKVGIMV